MKALVVGSRGMLGQRLCREALGRGWDVATLARTGADHCIDISNPENLLRIERELKADVVVNCAALVDLNECERDWEKCQLVNAGIAKSLAAISSKNGSYFIQISTDHFYTGDGPMKHSESAPIVLMNNYAKSKLEGEMAALQNPTALVVRTNIMGFRLDPRKKTFVEWAISELIQQKDMKGFVDFYTSGITTGELTRVLCELIDGKRPSGLWNIAGHDVFSKHDVLLAVGRQFGLKTNKLKPDTLKTLPGAKRAESLGLDSSRIEALLGRRMPGLEDTVRELYEEYQGSHEIQEFVHH